MARKKDSTKVIYNDPYRFFRTKYENEFLKSTNIKIDDFVKVEPDPKEIKKEINGQIQRAKKTKDRFVWEAMQYDPAFMLDPVNDYYKGLIPEQVLEVLSDDELEEIIAYYDPITWAHKNLFVRYGGFVPRVSKRGFPYQAQLIRTKSKRIATRAGRRTGKTLSIAVRVLHKAFTWKPDDKRGYYNIVIFTPNQTQINLIFKMFEMLLDGNNDLLSMVGKENKDKGKIPTRKTPNYVMELTNNVTISGFVSGSTAIRGSAADMLILDEASFLTTEDTDSVVALINEHPNVELWVSSTPSGPKDYFYDRINDPTFVSFHFPTDKYHPEWSHQMEQDFKRQLTISGFKHEVLAEFSEEGETVFQAEFVENALEDYKLKDEKRKNNWIYSIGIDWNDPENGTQICVVGYDIKNKKYRLVDKASVHIAGWTQTKAVEKVAEMADKWMPDSIYSDKGHGAAQIERLHELGLLALPNSPRRLLLKAKAIDFGSSIEIEDPWTKEKRKIQTKSYMVNNAVRVFEGNFINIPKEEIILINQLRGYNIDRINPLTGTPVYKPDTKYGDHELDALMLALFSFHVEYSMLTKFMPDPSLNSLNVVNIPTFITKLNNPYSKTSLEIEMDRDKQLEREEYEQAHAVFSPNNTSLTPRENSIILSPAIKRSSIIGRKSGITRKRL